MHKSDHQKISKFAIDISQGIFSSDFRKIVDQYGALVVEGSKKEDEGGLTRAKNWHFYRAENSPYLKKFLSLLGTIYPSSRNIYTIHTFELSGLLSKREKSDHDKIMLLTGRIIHHIQDMSTPAHVMPIYHGPAFPFSFSKKHDAFEEFSKNHIDNYLILNPGNVISNSVRERIEKESEMDLIDLYDLAANRTLVYLESDEATFSAYIDGKVKTVGSDLFWIKYDPEMHDGWGEYGPFGEAPKGSGVPFDTSDTREYKGAKYTIFFADYEHIYTHLVRQMIIDALTVLRHIEKKMFPDLPL
jgi:hypothetical protein